MFNLTKITCDASIVLLSLMSSVTMLNASNEFKDYNVKSVSALTQANHNQPTFSKWKRKSLKSVNYGACENPTDSKYLPGNIIPLNISDENLSHILELELTTSDSGIQEATITYLHDIEESEEYFRANPKMFPITQSSSVNMDNEQHLAKWFPKTPLVNYSDDESCESPRLVKPNLLKNPIRIVQNYLKQQKVIKEKKRGLNKYLYKTSSGPISINFTVFR